MLRQYGDSAIGHYHLFHYSPWLENKENEIFKAAYAKMFPKDFPEENVVLGYELGTMMVKAWMQAAGNPKTRKK